MAAYGVCRRRVLLSALRRHRVFHRDWLFDLPGADPLAYALCPNGCLRLAAAADREQRVRDRGVAGEETPLRRGQLFKADTLEALAVQIGVDLATFTAEMERYNSFCEAGRTSSTI